MRHRAFSRMRPCTLAMLAVLSSACASTGPRQALVRWQPTGERTWAPSTDCDVLRESDAWMTAHLGEGAVTLERTDTDGHGVTSAAAGACRSVPGLQDASFAVASGKVCMRGVDRGEWGGEFAIFESGRLAFSVEMSSPRPRRLVRASGQLLLLSGDLGTWGFSRVVRDAGGHWQLEPFVGLPGDMYAYGYDSRRRLLLAGTDGESDARCISGRRLYRVLEDGRIERLR